MYQLKNDLNRQCGRIVSWLKDFPDGDTRAFIAHNRKIWSKSRSSGNRKGEILIEGNNISACCIAMSYFGRHLGQAHNAKLVVYVKGLTKTSRAVFSSFADSFCIYSRSGYEEEIKKKFDDLWPGIQSKREMEDLKVDGVWIGDLIYDGYLRRHEKETLDLYSEDLKELVKESLGYLFHWQTYFNEHDVKSVVVSHCVYPWNAIIARIAIGRGIPVYLTQPSAVYYVTKTHNSRAYNEYMDYPDWFFELTSVRQKEVLAAARERLEMRFRGERDVGKHRHINRTYKSKTGDRILFESAKPKVLVASHCFSDDNHVYGNNLFPDIFEWMQFVGEISEKTDYDWYIKLHPDRFAWETKHVENFVAKYPKFTLLPDDASHHQIIEDGVDVVLTVYGTIGYEYAALGVPVITASQWNPTVAYDFNLHPKTIDEYRECLMNLVGIDLKINKDKVYEFYYCHFMDRGDDWLYDSYEALDSQIGGGSAHLGSAPYRIFLDQLSESKHARILSTVSAFVASGDYCLRTKHINSDREVSEFKDVGGAKL